jgi:threonylcarbamoyladenosine tRNA methylthiotransferase MtaB
LKPEEIANIEGVDLVLGAGQKFRILDYIEELSKSTSKGMIQTSDIREVNEFNYSFSFGDRTRSFLKVQDGCDYKCSFCTIPLARGRSRSDTVENVVQNAQKIAALGAKEIVLTGVNIGDFGNGTEVIEGDKPKKQALFIDLIKALDEEVEGIERFRISSIEPNLLTDEIIAFVAKSKRFVPHFHIPLQSGNNKQLFMMRRRYKRELYQDRVNSIKNLMPHACIGVDVIVGFPQETEEDFAESYRFIADMDISYLHIFTYSERQNTIAAEMENPVDMNIRRKRNAMLHILSDKKRRLFYEKYLGTVRPVLFEASKDEQGMMNGFTDNYIKIAVPYNETLINQVLPVQLINFSENMEMLIGSLT